MRTEALQRLLTHYDRYPPFVDDCRRLKASLPLPLIGHFAADYFVQRKALSAFADRWGLSGIPEMCECFYHHLRRAIEQVDQRFGSIVGTPFQPFSYMSAYYEPEDPIVQFDERQWTWHLGRFETLAECRDRIAADLDVVPTNLPAEVIQRLRSLPDDAHQLGWKLGDVPHKLPLHVSWLFLRLCPQPDHPLGPAAIASRETERTETRTVRRAVTALAQTMKIDLPVLQPGRPRGTRIAA